MAKKPTLDRLADFSRQPTANPKPEPETTAPIAARPKGNRKPFSSYVDADLVEQLRRLSLDLSAERGYRVSVADLVGEAFEDLITKYRR